jgi:hypothetical protein
MSKSRVVNLANFQQFTAINLLQDAGSIGGPVVIPLAWRCMLVWNLTNGHVARNILYGRVTAGSVPSVSQAQSVFTAITTGGTWTALAAHLAPTGSLAAVELQDVQIAGQPVVRSTSSAVPGASSGIALPDEVSVCVTLRTAQVGAGHRGRFYVPNWATTALATGNVVAAAAVTALQNWMPTILAAMSSNTMAWALGLQARQAYTGSSGTSHPARAATTELVTAQVVRDNHWDSQRRRGLK